MGVETVPAGTAGVPKETWPGERRVALTPPVVPALTKAGMQVLVERGAGLEAGFTDAAYEEKGATLRSRQEVLAADVLLRVRTPGRSPEDAADLDHLRPDQVMIGFADPLGATQAVSDLAARKITLFAVELVPRISRAQSMDALSSQSTVAGYKAVLLAADRLPKMFPMLTTAAGTIPPARVFVFGAGVAGLQAIATARRLGAVVAAYDVRTTVKEEAESVGAQFITLSPDEKETQDEQGYAKELGESFYQKEREVMTRVVSEHDVVITTALVPGKRAPLLLTRDMVEGMMPGSIVVDLAASQGGNCELTKPDEVVVHNGVTILGPTNIPAMVPYHASQMYARNLVTFLQYLVKEGTLTIDTDDEITRGTLVTRGGEIVNPKVREAMGLAVAEGGAA